VANKAALMLFDVEKQGRGGRVVINVDRGQVQASIAVFETTNDSKGTCKRLAETLNRAIETTLNEG
jgi:hypothetical protein